jgi:acyl carrier protein
MAVNDRIREFIQKELLLDARGTEVNDDTPLMEEALIDSIGVFSLAAFVEKEFGVEIHDQDMVPEHFGSVRSLARLVEAKRASGRSAG